MTCNYKNSAGTDLDSLFSINNSNAGAIGFKMSDGTDLGNRYSNSSSLNQTIGYKNSAGTDIGYLRGKATIPVINSHSASSSVTYQYRGNYAPLWTKGYISVSGASSSGESNVTWEVAFRYWHNESGYTHGYELWISPNSTSETGTKINWSGCAPQGNVSTTFKTVYSGSGGASRSMNFWWQLHSGDRCNCTSTDCVEWSSGEDASCIRSVTTTTVVCGANGWVNYMRVYQRWKSSVGWSDWVYNDVVLNV